MAGKNINDIIRATLEDANKNLATEEVVDDTVVDETEETTENEDEEVVDDTTDEVVEDEDEETVSEETLSASSLHPAAKSIGDEKALTASKIKMMQAMMGQMNGMAKTDLTDWFTKTMKQFGHWADKAPADAGKNSASIDMTGGKGPKTKMPMPKLNVREDLNALFDGQDLSEEFKEKSSTLFEAAISARLELEQAQLEEQYVEALEEQVKEIVVDMSSKLDTYLDYVVENWMKENEIAVTSTLRSQISEEFIDGLKELFNEHYITVPENKVDVLEELANKVNILEAKLNDTINENVELKSQNLEVQKNEIFEEVASNLALTQQEKFATLAEGIEFDGNLKVFEKKLMIIKESYFKEKNVTSSNIESETFEEDDSDKPTSGGAYPEVNRYVDAINRTVKNK